MNFLNPSVLTSFALWMSLVKGSLGITEVTCWRLKLQICFARLELLGTLV